LDFERFEIPVETAARTWGFVAPLDDLGTGEDGRGMALMDLSRFREGEAARRAAREWRAGSGYCQRFLLICSEFVRDKRCFLIFAVFAMTIADFGNGQICFACVYEI
jgi:hypothetical protein